MADLNTQPVWRQFPVSSPADVLIVRHAVDETAERLGFSPQRRAEAVLVASELAQNHVNCGTEQGLIALSGVFCGQAALLTLFSVDQGPGIDDVNTALRDGVTTGSSYGNGLGTVRRLADDFAICSEIDDAAPCGFMQRSPGKLLSGTMVAASLWWPRQGVIPPDNIRLSAIVSPMPGEKFCGDGVHIITQGDTSRIVLMDVLGHGPDAAESVASAHHLLDMSEPEEDLVQVVSRLDIGLSGRRGLAAIFMKADAATGAVQTCGVGNICACFYDGTQQFPVTSLSGVIGQNFNCRKLMLQDFLFTHDTTCVMFSDGLVASRRPQTCHNDTSPMFSTYLAFDCAVSGQDDASIIVWKWLKK